MQSSTPLSGGEEGRNGSDVFNQDEFKSDEELDRGWNLKLTG